MSSRGRDNEDCVAEFSDGAKLFIRQDEDPESPREWDNLGTMACFHKRYILGDKDHGLRAEDFDGWDAMRKHLEKGLGAVLVLPLYLYDHGGITISTGAFSCAWDSGQVGFIFVTEEKLNEEYGKRRPVDALETARKCLLGEVEVYDQYLRGDVYGYEIESANGEHVDSCWGFYGDTIAENGMMEHFPEQYRTEIEDKIAKKVPLAS